MKMPQISEMSEPCKAALAEVKKRLPFIDSGSFAVGYMAGRNDAADDLAKMFKPTNNPEAKA